MPEHTDERQSTVSDEHGLTPDEILTLARLERRLIGVRADLRKPAQSPSAPAYSEGISRVSPSAQIAR